MRDSKRRHRFQKSGGALLLCLLGALLAATSAAALPDGRGWEMVSPVEKNGGQVDLPGEAAGGGLLQAAAQGGLVTYSSRASFAGGTGAPVASQYIATRSGSGWSTQNITVPVFSGSYNLEYWGVPYRLFSPDLARAVMRNGDRCRSEEGSCPVANPPLPGSDAPEGYQDLYLREGGSFEALFGASDIAGSGISAADFGVSFVGASPDLQTVILASCFPAPTPASGCPASSVNLYKWSKSTGSLTPINSSPGAELANEDVFGPGAGTAVSADGNRIYWRNTNTSRLFLHEGTANIQIDTAAEGYGHFQVASTDGSVAYFTYFGHLWRWAGGTATDITPADQPDGGTIGVLGASADGSRVYFQDANGLQTWSGGITTTVASGAEAAYSDTYPPTTGASRVSADGTKLLFLSKEPLIGYNNVDKYTGVPDREVFLYDTAGPSLKCLSCNPVASKRPIGGSSIPGAIANGKAFPHLQSYKPRTLSANGRRVFFDSEDSLVAADSNQEPTQHFSIPDVYEWEAQGEGSCTKASGCLEILSNGALPEGAHFADASADGADAYFLTASSLVGSDPGSMDLYDARIGGGFPEPKPTISCNGDACQVLPPRPPDVTLATTLAGAGNPPVTYRKYCRQGYVKRKGLCVKRGSLKKKHHKKSAKKRRSH